MVLREETRSESPSLVPHRVGELSSKIDFRPIHTDCHPVLITSHISPLVCTVYVTAEYLPCEWLKSNIVYPLLPGPNYPAVCTQSLIGNHAVYDLILLEYYVNGAENGLAELATRLRTRFPEAIIIVMKFYGPFDALRASGPGKEDWQTLAEWKKSMNLPVGALNELVNAVEKDKGVWRFREHPNSDKAINRVVREINGYQFRLPKAETPSKTLVNYLRFFDKNMNQLLAERGHAWVADMCGKIVRRHILARQKPFSHVQRAKVGSWGKGDSCNVWKTSGGMPHEFSPGLVLNQYDVKRGKFALELRTTGWLDVENEFIEPRALYLSFMTSDVAGTYPNAVASIDGTSYPLNTNAKGKDIHKVGVVRTIPVGIIPGGKVTRVTLTTNMAGASLPFRLVGTTIPNPAVTPVEFNFGPMFNK